jgi:hypothetical protein
MGLGRLATYTKLSRKATTSLFQRRFVHIQNLHRFSITHLITIEIPAKGLAAGMVILGQVTTLPSIVINNCTPPITTLTPTCLPPTVPPTAPVKIPTLVDSPKPPSARRSDQTDELPNGFESPLNCRQGKTLVPPFAPISCFYRLMNVCNSFLGCSKVPYHVACLKLGRQHVKTEMCGPPVTRLPSMGSIRLRVIPVRPKEPPEGVCHGPLKEVDLLLRLRRHERRPWSEVTRLFSDRYPGRSPGSIQVYWSTALKNKANPPPQDPG